MSAPLPNFSIDLSGHVALVTGASSGLGARFARVLAAAGAAVAVTARRKDRLDALVAEIRANGGTAEAFALDVTDAIQLEAIVPTIAQSLGTVDILVNNAGIPDAQWAVKMSIDLIDRVIATNLRAPFILAREVAKALIAEGKPGRIVNISSMAAYDYKGNASALYSTTKAGVARMAEALSVEWAGRNINVNAIAPGAFNSEMMDGMVQRMGDITGGYPRKRLGREDQLDSTLLYLVSPASECVTGTVIKVDDGQHYK